ncbi:MAG TPA: hypothetical protein O0W90_02635, partial [Methanocorpusculum sp.]|nr:hypothetical protein [Methanocorpusculum sp.]
MKLSIVSDGKPPSSRALHKAVRAVLLSFLIIFVCASAFCGCVSADTDGDVTISTDDPTNWTYLVENLSSDKSKVTVTLECDIYNNKFWTGGPAVLNGLAAINISSGDKTLNLNGHNIFLGNATKNDYNILFNVTNGSKFTIMNSGAGENNISANVTNMIGVWSGGNFTLGKNVNLTTYGKPNGLDGKQNCMVIAIQGQNKDAADISYVKLEKGSTVCNYADFDNLFAIVIVQDGFLSSNEIGPAYGVNLEISGNVTGHRGIWLNGMANDVEHYPNITINNGAFIDADKGCAVYASGYGNWIFENGCKLNGTEALSIRSGKFTIKGGEFIGKGKYYDTPKKQGSEGDSGVDMGNAYFSGAAISIVNDSDTKTNYAGNVNISIEDGTFTSDNGHAFLESSLKSMSALGEGITITGGKFITHAELYPINISNIEEKPVSVTLNEKTPCYPGLNTSWFRWAKGNEESWTVTVKEEITNLDCINLTHIDVGKTATLNLNGKEIKSEEKGNLLGWNNSTENGNVIDVKQTDSTVFEGKKAYYPLFGYYVTFNNSSGSCTGTMENQSFVNG